MNTKLGVGYIRTATINQTDSTVPLQEKAIKAHLNQLGCNKVIIFQDLGKSGLDKNRRGLKLALKTARNRHAAFFCCTDFNRISRNSEYLIRMTNFLKDIRCQLVFASEPQLTGLYLDVLSAISHFSY